MFFRCYARDPSINLQGNPAGGCIGFLKSLQKSIRLTQPDDVIIVWDGAEALERGVKLTQTISLEERLSIFQKTWDTAYPKKKNWTIKSGNNPDFDYLDNLPILQFMFEDVEADDVISAIVQSREVADYQKVILSNDKDFMQLCDDTTILYRPAKKPWEILNTKIVDEYNIHPKNITSQELLGR